MSEPSMIPSPTRTRGTTSPVKLIIGKILVGLFGLVMLGSFLGGVAVLGTDHQLTVHHLTARGTVTDISGSANSAQLQVAFTTATGRKLKVWVDDAGSAKIGDTVTVEYSPDDPTIARVGHGELVTGLAMTCIGLIGAIAAAIAVFGRRKNRPSP